MKTSLLVGLLVLSGFVSCDSRRYTDPEIQALLVGSWRYTSSFQRADGDAKTSIETSGRVTFDKEGGLVSEGETLLTVAVAEGSIPVRYRAVVTGSWSVEGHALHAIRKSEEIVPTDRVSEKFIQHERMRELRSKAPTHSVVHLESVSPRRIRASRSDGTRILYQRAD